MKLSVSLTCADHRSGRPPEIPCLACIQIMELLLSWVWAGRASHRPTTQAARFLNPSSACHPKGGRGGPWGCWVRPGSGPRAPGGLVGGLAPSSVLSSRGPVCFRARGPPDKFFVATPQISADLSSTVEVHYAHISCSGGFLRTPPRPPQSSGGGRRARQAEIFIECAVAG